MCQTQNASSHYYNDYRCLSELKNHDIIGAVILHSLQQADLVREACESDGSSARGVGPGAHSYDGAWLGL